MTEYPLEHHAVVPRLKEEHIEVLASPHAQLSLRGKRVFDCLVVLLRSHLRSHAMSRVFPFQPALLYSICHALVEQDDPSILALVLSKLRDWRLLDPDHRCSPAGIHKLALGLSRIVDGDSTSSNSNPHQASYARLRMKWVGTESPSENQDSESSMPTAPSAPSPTSRSDALDVAQECAHTLLDLGGCRLEVGDESSPAGRAGTPDSEESSGAVAPPRHRSGSGFRSSCSACRHLRLPGLSPPPSPGGRNASVPFSDVNRFEMNNNPSISASARPPTLIPRYATPRKTKRTKLKSLNSIPHIDENERHVPKPIGRKQGVGILFPLHRTRTACKLNTLLSRDPFSPVAASAQHRLEPNQACQGDKHTVGHRVASVDPGLSMAHPCPSRASPNDLHPHAPTHTSSLSHSPGNSHEVGSVRVGTLIPKLSSNAAAFRSSKQLPSWSHTHLVRPRATTTTSVTPPRSVPAKAHLGNSHARLSGVRSVPSSTLIPRRVPGGMNMECRDRRAVSSQTPKHTSNDGVLPHSRAPTLSHPRRWQV